MGVVIRTRQYRGTSGSTKKNFKAFYSYAHQHLHKNSQTSHLRPSSSETTSHLRLQFGCTNIVVLIHLTRVQRPPALKDHFSVIKGVVSDDRFDCNYTSDILQCFFFQRIKLWRKLFKNSCQKEKKENSSTPV